MFTFDHSYARDLPGCFADVVPRRAPSPALLRLNHDLAADLGLDLTMVSPERVAALLSGTEVPSGARPIAQAYAGHQFGGFSPQLGDGRALLLGEVCDRAGRRRDIALKGSGRTPFSRGGDGKAAVGPVLREYVMGEAMHALGIPTTRALAAVATGDEVVRERVLPGAVLMRVAASHLRVGTFEFFAARGQHETVRQLAHYAIARHDPEIAIGPGAYVDLLRAVTARQAELVASWMLVGFIHGVMNTDNMTISGETIDYGPCAFMEAYDEAAVFSSIDHAGRYAYGNQPAIAQWNLARFAETLLPLIDANADVAVARATDVVGSFGDLYEAARLRGLRLKLGLADAHADDATLAADWLSLLQEHRVDYTTAWRSLADAAVGDSGGLEACFGGLSAVATWLDRWQSRAGQERRAPAERARGMRLASPAYIPRNHVVEHVLAAASDAGDLAPLDRLLEVVRSPYEWREGAESYAQPAPREVTARYRTYCGT